MLISAFIYKSHGVLKIHLNKRKLDNIILGNIILFIIYELILCVCEFFPPNTS